MNYVKDPTMPDPLYRALVESDSEYGDEVKSFLSEHKGYDRAISVTSLNTPAQKYELIRRNASDIWIDPEKCWHSLMGNVVHFVLEKQAAGNPRYMTEVRMGCTVSVNGKKVFIHGKFDLYDKETCYIEDWKLTNASSMVYDKSHYEMQLNILRYIMRRNGFEVKGMRDIYLFPHLDKTKANVPGYPKRHFLPVEVAIMPHREIEEIIINKAAKKLEQEGRSFTDLTPCTDEERWVRGSFWSIYTRKKTGFKKGETPDFSSRAAMKADTKSELIKWRKANRHKKADVMYKEYKGSPKHCEFCQASPFCSQYQREKLAYIQQQKNKDK